MLAQGFGLVVVLQRCRRCFQQEYLPMARPMPLFAPVTTPIQLGDMPNTYDG